MQGKFEEAYAQLNAAQRLAVDTIEGPVLVIAGPGTGKTQLLTTRIANILTKTDVRAANILCLTFTESGAQTMRERLVNFIGQAAYDVTISTYHAFGSDLIRRFPDYFAELADTEPVDDLGADSILREIVGALPYSNPLKFSDNYLNDIRGLISDAKRALLTPEDLHAIAKQNLTFIAKASPIARECLASVARIDKKSATAFAELFSKLSANGAAPVSSSELLPRGKAAAEPKVSADNLPAALRLSSSEETGAAPLASLFIKSLAEALQAFDETGKTTAITTWKNAWLAKDEQGHFIVDGEKANRKLQAAADIYAKYLNELRTRKLFDYDDMILHAVRALETHADLRYSLQEQYLYVLLDEFQDTNGAQLRLVELLTDSPVHEGRPNVLAVGDDDQAIYAFQGADYSHMLQFQRMYRDVLLVPLTVNYRSHAAILHVARGIAEQIEERLHHHFPAIEKTLTAGNAKLPAKSIIERREAKSDVAQFSWVAKKIRALLDSGVPASEIAVLAPQHKYLEPCVAFLQQEQIPVRYEKRENVLDDAGVNQLLSMSRLVLALARGEHAAANHLWSEVLSFSFWHVPTSVIWELSWQASDARGNWTDLLLKRPALQPIALFFVRLSFLAGSEPLETMLDYLVGVQALDPEEPGSEPFTSPFYEHYFGSNANATSPSAAALSSEELKRSAAGRLTGETTGSTGALPRGNGSEGESAAVLGARNTNFWDLLTNLIVLRSRLREHRANSNEPFKLADFINFVEAHRAADIKILNTSPYQEASESVQMLTAFKAKGQEYAAVFVLGVNDEAWGSKARGQSSRLSIPPNLQFIRYAGATNDERLRLFYVAVTRAKTQLYLVNYTYNYAGKGLSRLKYLNETADKDGVVTSPLLPGSQQTVLPAEEGSATPSTELTAYWQQRHEQARSQADLRALLGSRLERFQLSATHICDFIDIIHCGPEPFFLKTILRFPQAPAPEMQYGNAMHETLEWLHHANKREGAVPSPAATLATFERLLRAKQLEPKQTELLLARGQAALPVYLQQRAHTISPSDQSEYNFRTEGVFAGPAHLGGKIDKLIINKTDKTITIVDYKTGRAHHRWQRDSKLHKYELQLYFYKLLVEGSHTFAGYRVTDAYLEFVEPDEHGNITELHVQFTDEKMAHLTKLIAAVWQRVQTLDLPNVSDYSKDMSGLEAFEQYLITA
ncbi:MAG TPA: ATP-dependent DNA helicase [Candidatus Saccharimonadales bacterium]|nr:ATP-dependent DNA helicase [Candidatus Saccharimonadales bacterium]